jgi:serine/threonine protein kinase
MKDYVIIKTLYESNSTTVYRAKNKNGNSVIIKTLSSQNRNKKYFFQLKKEFQILKMFDHPHIIQAIELIEEEKKIYLVEEDIFGLPINEILKQEKFFNLDEFLELAIYIVKAIDTLHSSGIIHKDIKPHNIIYNREKKFLKIIDFDHASFFSRETPEYSTNILEGTLDYISPEQTGRTGRKIDYRTDYYSLGVTLYEMACGNLPFEGKSAIELIHKHTAENPKPVYLLNSNIPKTISDIILKLLSKLPENRYQTSNGLLYDLEKAKNLLHENKPIEFSIAEKDFSTNLLIPEKLYGREKESKQIQEIFESFYIKQTNVFNVLIRAQAGMGKMSVAQEIYPNLLKKNGYSIYFKFDSNIEKNLQEIFSSLLNQYLLEVFKENHDYIKNWKLTHQHFLEKNLTLILKLFPNSKNLFSNLKQYPKENYDSKDILEFFDFLNTLDRPILLLFENAQYMPEEFSKILELWFGSRKNINLFIIYTAEELKDIETHFCSSLLKTMREKKILEEIYLYPLTTTTISLILTDILHSQSEDTLKLAEVLHEKTNGNPFFLFQFLTNLYKKSLLHPPSKKDEAWTWNLELIKQEPITENVAYLLYEKLEKVDSTVREILKISACCGDETSLFLLSCLLEKTELEIATLLNPVLTEKMISINHNNIVFLHSKFRNLIYNSIENNEKILIHKKIANAFKKLNTQLKEDFDLDFTYHQNLTKLLLDKEEKLELLEKNLQIAREYAQTMNYEKASEYYTHVLELVELISLEVPFSKIKNLKEIFEEAIKTEIETLDFKQAENYLQKAKTFFTDLELFEAILLQAKNKFKDSTYIALEALKKKGFQLEFNPKKTDEFNELFKIKNLELDLSSNFKNLKLANLDTVKNHELFFIAITSSWSWNIILFSYLGLKLLENSLNEGFSYLTPIAFLIYSIILITTLENSELAEKISSYAEQLMNYFQYKGSDLAFSFIYYSFLQPWNVNLKELHELLLSFKKTSLWLQFRYISLNILSSGLLQFLSRENINNILFFLKKQEEQIQKSNQKDCENFLNNFINFLEILLKGKDKNLNLEVLDSFLHSDNNIYTENVHFKFVVNVFKIFACYLSENFLEAYKLARLCEDSLKFALSHVFLAEFLFIDSLVCFALFKDSNEEYKEIYKNHILKNREKLKIYCSYSEDSFLSKLYIVEAEIAKIANDRLAAIDFYTKAIEFSKKNEFLLEEAIANELLGKFWAENGQASYEELHIVKAIKIFALYGANIKVELLKQKYPKYYMKNIERNVRFFSSKTSSSFHLESLNPTNIDIQSILKSTYSISSDVNFDEFLSKINKIIVEQSGAERSLILLKDKSTQLFYIENDYNINFEHKNQTKTLYENYTNISKAIVSLCERTGQIILTKEAYKDKRFQIDPYIMENQIKSILCIPIVVGGVIEGIIYLENNLITDAFPSHRIDGIVQLISQVIISIKNAQDYLSLKEELNQCKKLITWESINFLRKKANSEIEPGNYLTKEFTVAIVGIESFETLEQNSSSGQILAILNLLYGMIYEKIQNKGYIDKILRDKIIIVLDCDLYNAFCILEEIKKTNLYPLLKYHLTTAISNSLSTIGIIGKESGYRTTLFSRSEEICLVLEQVSRKYKTSTLILEEEFKNLPFEKFSYRLLGPILFQFQNLWVIEILGEKTSQDSDKNNLFTKAIRKLWKGNLTEAEYLLYNHKELYEKDTVVENFLALIEHHKNNHTKPKFLNL